ncbi:MAG: hypothetical protein A2Y64_08780 [Candidatus Coatesbacteria bacterium RBG_13_66_14]|uniref:Methylmalonyl-CoA mutase alpha/beta chain catalytic domain-containing protein n=1 Tax=Candidatus Coatesbacteria bacterium RBG_13_66_14 TaxID=1817816 RepID=A0A1F5F230_9BACT|nr:MAG: hypothetical protein A2Y64_08780 [Candidatus Coatesbacteria bacterium RBG_13_66_14]
MNCFPDPELQNVELLKVNPELGRERRGRLAKYRSRRTEGPLAEVLGKLKNAAGEDGAPLMEPITDCVRAGGTVGEIAEALRGVFGSFDEK